MNRNMNIDFIRVGNLLKLLRESENLTQTEVANELGVSKVAISNWESGLGIKTEHLFNLAEFYNVTVEELITGKLDGESEVDVFKRNYDLSQKPNFDDDSPANMNNVYKYLDKCLFVKNIFFNNYYKWKKKEVDQQLSDKMEFISQFFEFKEHYGYGICKNIDSEFNLIDDLVEDVNFNNDNEDYDEYRLSVAFSLDIEVPLKRILHGVDEKLTSKVLSLCSQYEKDRMLTEYAQSEDKLDFDKNFNCVVYMEPLIKNGARFLYDICDLPADKTSELFEFNSCQGMKENTSKNKASETLHKIFRNINQYPDFEVSKSMYDDLHYCDYLSLINYEKTEYYYNIVMYKDKEPLKFYERLVRIYWQKDC